MPKSRLRLDIETYSSVDLRKTGVYRYAASPDFMILMCGWSLDGSPVQVAIGHDEIMAIPGLQDPAVLKVAHNAQFERVCFSAFLGLPPGVYLDPEDWHDTQAVAGEYGWPQKLEHLARAMGTEKDEAGTRLINLFCKPRTTGKLKGTRCLPEEKPMEWLDFIAYCDQDVVALCEIDDQLGDFPTQMERQVFLADQRINDRGMAIDVQMAQAALVASKKNEARQMFELSDATGWEVLNANSNPQMMAWVEAQGLPAKNLQKETVERLLELDLTYEQRTVLELRQDLALVALKKYPSALASVLPDDRLRGTLKFAGAHTLRWAGRGTQVQNLPREAIGLTDEQKAQVVQMKADGVPKAEIEAWVFAREEDNVDAAIRRLKHGHDVGATILKALVRALFLGPLTVVDYSAIEARVIAWLAGEEWALQAFRDGRDIYVETADRMSTPDRPLDRSQGKVAVLALGYNGAVNSLRAMGAEGDDNELMVLVKQWRKANPAICRMWQELGDAFGEPAQVGQFLRTTEGQDAMGRSVTIHLPSGRGLTYHGVRWERYRVKDPKRPGKYIDKEGWRYADPRHPFEKNWRIGTYGGRLAENVTQAVARDIMAEALVRLEAAGFEPVGHVHDEILTDGEHDVELISGIMTQLPTWATGLPVDAEGFTCRRYRKG